MSLDNPTIGSADATITLLDVGARLYADAILCSFGGCTVLIDGGHVEDTDLLWDQLSPALIDATVDLLVVSHPHYDHIGCLPVLVSKKGLKARWVLAADPQYTFGVPAAGVAQTVLNALKEEPHAGQSDASVDQHIQRAATTGPAYEAMLGALAGAGAKVIRYDGLGDAGSARPLIAALKARGIDLSVFGPTAAHLKECAALIRASEDVALPDVHAALQAAAQRAAPHVAAYHATAPHRSIGNLINLQSLVVRFAFAGRKYLFAGDMQLADPETPSSAIKTGLEQLLARVREEAPYDFYKMPHHGSKNGTSSAVLSALGSTKVFGINLGTGTPTDPSPHPSTEVLELLSAGRTSGGYTWARTDHNGRSTFAFAGAGAPQITPAHPPLDDATPNARPKPAEAAARAAPTPAAVP